MNGQGYLVGADRAEYDLASTLHVAVWPRPIATVATAGSPITWTLGFAVVPSGGNGQRTLHLLPDLSAPAYPITEGLAYAIPLSRLREPDGSAADLSPGDRLSISAIPNADTAHALVLDLGLVADPVCPPPAAVYGPATVRGGTGIGAPLFASAPLPAVIEFPSLVDDLKAGHVRRRALFIWAHAPPSMPAAGAPYATLVKADRTGGGQQPDSVQDFQGVEGSSLTGH